MNEEQAVLDFFSQPKNLPLALSVGELVDRIRLRSNNEFWNLLAIHLQSRLGGWTCATTADRGDTERLVGLNLRPAPAQELFIQPMLEQQFNRGELRVYFGLMWSSPAPADKSNLAEVAALHDALERDGYKDNAGFLAWRWTNLHPRRKDFLLRFDAHRAALLDSAAADLCGLLDRHGELLRAANLALSLAPKSAAISLNSLRANLPNQTGIS